MLTYNTKMKQELFNPQETKPRFFIRFDPNTGRTENLGQKFRRVAIPDLPQIR